MSSRPVAPLFVAGLIYPYLFRDIPKIDPFFGTPRAVPSNGTDEQSGTEATSSGGRWTGKRPINGTFNGPRQDGLLPPCQRAWHNSGNPDVVSTAESTCVSTSPCLSSSHRQFRHPVFFVQPPGSGCRIAVGIDGEFLRGRFEPLLLKPDPPAVVALSIQWLIVG